MRAEVFGNFQDNCIEIYKLDPACFLFPPELACQACFKKTQVELELLTDLHFFSFIYLFSHNIKLTQFTTIYRNEITIIITTCERSYTIDDSNKIFLVQK